MWNEKGWLISHGKINSSFDNSSTVSTAPQKIDRAAHVKKKENKTVPSGPLHSGTFRKPLTRTCVQCATTIKGACS
ncbi:unnamed protein product [Bursaphelenchus xylophilus]|uniref:(pine wood nematode) hypothetical protein n=1 Tax=Bursaphelenchus xylophilus TaxID=6326 RepID=A0A7I8XM39_BURXY|nr:unnamed protein product [Bursaphelenchus xylophilus]CAG9089815.1 unnamed protein product [Bursaphelenchus xylophilus]